MSIWVPSPNFDAGRPGPIKWIIWHTTEGTETTGSAYAVASGWFALDSAQVSAHIVVDDGSDPRYPDGVVECVKPENRAWQVGPAGNPLGYGIEIVGTAEQTAAQWADAYSTDAILNACTWILATPVLAAIPRHFLTDDQLRAGASGHITHAMVSRVLGGTDHTDPGPNFPSSIVEHYLNGGHPMNWTDTAIPDYSKTPPTDLQVDVTLGWMALHAGQAASSAADAAATAHAVSAKVDALAAKVAALPATGGSVDLDALAQKVADVLSARLAS